MSKIGVLGINPVEGCTKVIDFSQKSLILIKFQKLSQRNPSRIPQKTLNSLRLPKMGRKVVTGILIENKIRSSLMNFVFYILNLLI